MGAHVTGDIIEQPEGIVQDKKNRGRRQRGERPLVRFGGEGWTMLVGAFSSHSFRSPSMGLARAVSSPELGPGRRLPLSWGTLLLLGALHCSQW